jgi:hypothetical protein
LVTARSAASRSVACPAALVADAHVGTAAGTAAVGVTVGGAPVGGVELCRRIDRRRVCRCLGLVSDGVVLGGANQGRK